MTDAPRRPSSKSDDPANDPRGLIAEAYRMPDLVPEAARAIFFDWALGRSEAEGDPTSVARLRAHYAPLAPDHPMTGVLAEGLAGRKEGARPRRSGRRATRGD